MNIFKKIALLTCALVLSFSVLAAGDYTITGMVVQITSKKVVMNDGTVLKMPSYRPESKVKVTYGKVNDTLAMLLAVGYIHNAAITLDSDNVVKKIFILEMK